MGNEKHFDEELNITCISGYEKHISRYCVIELRDDAMICHFIARNENEIYDNITLINEKNYNIGGFEIYNLYKENEFIQELDWIDNEECAKMMLCNYSQENIEEYLKSLL